MFDGPLVGDGENDDGMKRWYFWVLAPIMLATGFGLPFIVEPPTRAGYIVVYAFSGGLILATIGLANPRRFKPALKVVATLILMAYVGYAGSEAIDWAAGKPFYGDGVGGTSLYLALRGLMVFGLPSLYFITRGRSGSAVDFMLEPDNHRSASDKGAQ